MYIEYHDREWGVPLHNNSLLFEMLILEGAQAGLSWITILKKRENYHTAFDGFDAKKISEYGERKVSELMLNKGIIRNRLKILAAIQNARALLAIQEELGSFDKYIWKFVGEKQKQNFWKAISEVPSKSPESEAMSKALVSRGFKFVGPTICYSFMQATGMVNDHLVGCFRHRECSQDGQIKKT